MIDRVLKGFHEKSLRLYALWNAVIFFFKEKIYQLRGILTGQGSIRRIFKSEEGQGTTEYAILVGVLVVIAIVAIVAFKPTIQSLWDSITDGIKSLK